MEEVEAAGFLGRTWMEGWAADRLLAPLRSEQLSWRGRVRAVLLASCAGDGRVNEQEWAAEKVIARTCRARN